MHTAGPFYSAGSAMPCQVMQEEAVAASHTAIIPATKQPDEQFKYIEINQAYHAIPMDMSTKCATIHSLISLKVIFLIISWCAIECCPSPNMS